MFVLNCDITIGSYRMNSVHDVRITKSIHSFIDTCKIKIPSSARLEFYGQRETQSIIQADEFQDTANLFQVGNPVIVSLGYDEEMEQEFKGFVKRVNFTTPLEIECEGYSWQLKQLTINKSWKTVTLKSLLTELIQGTDIKLNPDIPDVSLNNVFFRNVTRDQVLNWIQSKLLMTVYFDEDILYAGLAFTEYKNDVKYKLGWNTIKDDQLKFHLATDTKIKIKAIYIRPDNSRLEAEVGDADGGTRTVFISNISSLAQLKDAALNKLKLFKYDGYYGKITTFLQPFAQHGDKAILNDPKYPERSGNYMIESVEVQFGTNGGRRICEIGIKV